MQVLEISRIKLRDDEKQHGCKGSTPCWAKGRSRRQTSPLIHKPIRIHEPCNVQFEEGYCFKWECERPRTDQTRVYHISVWRNSPKAAGWITFGYSWNKWRVRTFRVCVTTCGLNWHLVSMVTWRKGEICRGHEQNISRGSTRGETYCWTQHTNPTTRERILWVIRGCCQISGAKHGIQISYSTACCRKRTAINKPPSCNPGAANPTFY